MLLKRRGHCGFARSRQAREPYCESLLSPEIIPFTSGQRWVPRDVAMWLLVLDNASIDCCASWRGDWESAARSHIGHCSYVAIITRVELA